MFDYAYEPRTWLPYLAILADFAKAAAWPIALFLAVRLFRADIEKLLPRILKAGPAGLELSPDKTQGSIAENIENRRLPVPDVSDASDRPVVALVKSNIIKDLSDMESSEDRQNKLINALAFERIERHMIYVYYNIFGSQIEALRYLNQSGGSVSLDTAKARFLELKEREEVFENWSFEDYIRFLINNQFIETTNELVSLKDQGKYFLQFLTNYGLAENRPF